MGGLQLYGRTHFMVLGIADLAVVGPAKQITSGPYGEGAARQPAALTVGCFLGSPTSIAQVRLDFRGSILLDGAS